MSAQPFTVCLMRAQSKLDACLVAAAALPADAVEAEERRREAGRRRVARAAKQRLQDLEHVRWLTRAGVYMRSVGTGISEGSKCAFALAVSFVMETESWAAGSATMPCAQPVWRGAKTSVRDTALASAIQSVETANLCCRRHGCSGPWSALRHRYSASTASRRCHAALCTRGLRLRRMSWRDQGMQTWTLSYSWT